MNEILKTRESQIVNIGHPLAARAVALCEGCPMAKFCAIKVPGQCPPDIQQYGGDLQMPAEISQPPKSYRNLLRDDNVPAVMATPRKVLQAPRPQPPVRPQKAKTPLGPPPQRKSKLARPKIAGESVPEQVAEVLIDMFSVRSLQKARAKK